MVATSELAVVRGSPEEPRGRRPDSREYLRGKVAAVFPTSANGSLIRRLAQIRHVFSNDVHVAF